LNGDGKPEVIAAVPGGKVVVLAPRRAGDGFARALVIAELDVGALLQAPPDDPPRLLALRSGFLTPQPRELVRAPRKQVLVLVTSDMEVLCLDHNLRLVWRQSLAAHFPSHGQVRELAVHVSEHSVDKGDRGLVVVGASVVPLTLADREEGG
jgi:hypothetical protein